MASIRRAARQLQTSPAFTAMAVLTLALGIGATTAIFTLIDAVMLRPLPVSDPGRLYRIGDGDDTLAKGRHGRWGFFSYPLYERLQAATPEFADVTAFDWGGTSLSVRRQGSPDAATPVNAEYVTGSYFSTLGVGAFGGRVLAPADDAPAAAPVLVLSHRIWQAAYGSDPSVVGAVFVVEGHPLTVVGVAAPGFFGETVRADPPDMFIPLQHEPAIAGARSLLNQSMSPWLAAIGRRRPDASMAGMDARLTAILRHWIQDEAGYPAGWMPEILRDLPKQTIAVVPAGAGIGLGGLSAKEQYGPSLQFLLAICGLALLISCANVASLLLARAAARRGHTAVRLALGATRRQIAVEALIESLVLAIAGGLAGLLVASGVARLLVALLFRSSHVVPIATAPSLPVFAFAVALSVATGVVFGVAPAWFQSRTDPIAALRGSERGVVRASSRARATLLIAQATLSVVAVAVSAVLGRSLVNLLHQDFGYRLDGRVVIGLKRLPPSYTPQQLSTLYREVEQRLMRLPGVRGAGLALYNPLASNWTETVLVAGHAPKAAGESDAAWDRVSAEYLQNLGDTVVRGRPFAASDRDGAAPVAIVNDAFVKRFFEDDEDPIGQLFGVDRADTFRIVGIARDAKFARSGLRKPVPPMFFLPLAQQVAYESDYRRMIEVTSHTVGGLLLVTDAPVGTIEPLLRKTLAAADPNLTITSLRTLAQQVDLSFDRERAIASLAALFGLVALGLAAVGVYGVTDYLVTRQTSEIGIRMALGAGRVRVMQFVLRRACQCVMAGLALGIPLAVAATKLMATRLYGVSTWDPFALTLAAGSLAACAFVAAMVPAWRAAATAPIRALRAE